MPTDRTDLPSGAAPQAAVRNNANVFGWTALAAGALVALSLCVFFGNEMLGAKEPVSVTLRDSTAATTAAAFVGAADEKPAAGTGTFKGVVTFKGKPPARKVLVPKGGVGNPDVKPEDRAICAADDLLSDELIVNEKADNAVANVVIYLKKSPEGYTAPPVPTEPAVLDQKGCRFHPHVLVLRCNQKLIVKNGDGLPHNTHFTPIRNQGENKAIGANDRVGFDFVYKKPESVPVPVVCDYHKWMKAHQLPLEHPFAAATDADGKFEIKGLPPGKYEFTIWHEAPGYLTAKHAVEIKADKVTEEKLSYTAAQFKVGN